MVMVGDAFLVYKATYDEKYNIHFYPVGMKRHIFNNSFIFTDLEGIK